MYLVVLAAYSRKFGASRYPTIKFGWFLVDFWLIFQFGWFFGFWKINQNARFLSRIWQTCRKIFKNKTWAFWGPIHILPDPAMRYSPCSFVGSKKIKHCNPFWRKINQKSTKWLIFRKMTSDMDRNDVDPSGHQVSSTGTVGALFRSPPHSHPPKSRNPGFVGQLWPQYL